VVWQISEEWFSLRENHDKAWRFVPRPIAKPLKPQSWFAHGPGFFFYKNQ
jgi:hypothetical protein